MEYRPMAQLPKGISDMVRGYLECAEWCGLEDADREALELAVSPKWTAEAIQRATEDCGAFLADHATEIGSKHSRAGNDFWLTRNQHGAGFWDGDWENEETLTKGAHAYGEAYVSFDADTEQLSLS